jgi:2',3'-cyclic-nucleotide 2'-phosphodiesterase (5'-nucleotidase family)
LIQIARKENPGNTLYFDSGDQFQGGLESSPLITSGSLLNAYSEYLKLDGAAVGNH